MGGTLVAVGSAVAVGSEVDVGGTGVAVGTAVSVGAGKVSVGGTASAVGGGCVDCGAAGAAPQAASRNVNSSNAARAMGREFLDISTPVEVRGTRITIGMLSYYLVRCERITMPRVLAKGPPHTATS